VSIVAWVSGKRLIDMDIAEAAFGGFATAWNGSACGGIGTPCAGMLPASALWMRNQRRSAEAPIIIFRVRVSRSENSNC